jgi:hypothetical protein
MDHFIMSTRKRRRSAKNDEKCTNTTGDDNDTGLERNNKRQKLVHETDQSDDKPESVDLDKPTIEFYQGQRNKSGAYHGRGTLR